MSCPTENINVGFNAFTNLAGKVTGTGTIQVSVRQMTLSFLAFDKKNHYTNQCCSY